MKNEKGFTLIEIIAVLVILGVLAAVAIPRYQDLMTESRGKALEGALAALQSSATMDYSRGLMNGNYSTNNGPLGQTGVVVGDFSGSWTTAVNGNITVTVTDGPPNWDDVGTANVSKDFRLY